MPLQVRRGQTADRLSITPIIGELIYDTTEKTLYIGDGTTPGGIAASSFTFEDAQDAAASLLTSGIHSNISFSYNDTANRIDASLDLSSYSGIIESDGFKGSVFANDSSLLIDSVLGSFQLDGTVRTDIIPFSSETYDLGSPTNRFRDLYLSGSSLWIGDAQVTASNTSVNLPIGSTIGGVEITGVVSGSNYNINIIGDDSSLIVNSSNGSITAPGGILGNVTGDVSGSVFGNNSAIIIDAIDNEIRGGFEGSLVGDFDTNINRIVSDDTIFMAPENKLFVGSESLARDGSIHISRNSYNGDISTGSNGFYLEQHHNNFRADRVIFAKTRGSSASVQPVQKDDQLGELTWLGWPQSDDSYTIGAAIRIIVDEEPTGPWMPSSIMFRTASNSQNNRGVVKIDSQGRLLASVIAPYSDNLEINGNVIGDVTGSIFIDDSTRIIDGTDGSITAPSFIQFGSLTATERNTLVASNGMVIYNTTYNRFEGYQNGAWINLDDGTTAGA